MRINSIVKDVCHLKKSFRPSRRLVLDFSISSGCRKECPGNMKELQGEAAGENSDGMRAQKDTPETRTNVDPGGRAAARVAGQRYRSAGSAINGREHRFFSEGAQPQDGNGSYGETHLLTSILTSQTTALRRPPSRLPSTSAV